MSENAKHKIYDYEVNPPEKVWESIAAALDESEMHRQFPSTLYDMEVAAPAGAWGRIREAMDQEDKVVVIAPRKISPFLRYAAAAVIAGLILFASLQIFKKTPGNKEVATKEKSSEAPTNTPALLNNDTSATLEDEQSTAVLQPTQDVVASLNQASKSQKRNTGKNVSSRNYQRQSRSSAEVNYAGSHDEGGMLAAIAHSDIRLPENKNRYVMLMTPDGNIIRMSKKLGGLVCCVSGQEQDAACKSQLKLWQEKMASSIIAPSAGNFLDIVNLVNTLQGAILNNR